MHFSAFAALRPLVVAWTCGAWLIAALLLELHWHRSRVAAIASVLPALAAAGWFGAPSRPRTRGELVAATARASLLGASFVAALVLFDHHDKHRGAWGLWVPAMTLDFMPSMLAALPELALACAAALALSYWWTAIRAGRLGFVIAYVWPATWAFLAFNGFYRASFVQPNPLAIRAQPGVDILAANSEASCALFASHCSVRLFPRGLQADEQSRTLFASFGSTAADLHRTDPKLLAVALDNGTSQWLDGTEQANQLRNFTIDHSRRLLVFSQWGSNSVAVYDLDTRRLLESMRYTLDEQEDYAPFNVLLDGDRVIVSHIWPPRVVVYSLSTQGIEQMIDLYDRGLVGIGVQIAGAALSQRRSRLWLAIAQPGDNVLELDLSTLEPMRGVDLDVTFPASFTYSDEQGRTYTTSLRSSSIEVVDVDSMQKVDELGGVIGARDVLVDVPRQTLVVSDYLRGDVVFLSLRARAVTRRVQVGPKPGASAIVGSRLYVSSAVGIVSIALD
jgi:hypothetical protein